MSTLSHRIGFMQGRLSPRVDGKIQAFPKAHWRDEFASAQTLGFARLEWTLDHEELAANPLMTAEGQADIRALSATHGVAVSSLTGDCFMQAPFWKTRGGTRMALIDEMAVVVRGGAAVGASIVVVPLVDNGSLSSSEEEAALAEGLAALTPLLRETRMRVAFESDYPPPDLVRFMAAFPRDVFGVNFDMGNSASLGWAPRDEIPLIAHRLINVHVKDRVRGGTTVPLGQGDADLPTTFRLLNEVGYDGFLILQTARSADGDDAGVARAYRDLVLELAGGS
jgi:L-ribulose-5-phosphate 3-epimerase